MTNVKMFSSKASTFLIGSGVMLSLAFGLFMPFSADAAMLYRQLQKGMTGSDVSDLQVFLATDATIYPQGLVTGYFGNLTFSAVSNFQARNGIATVGRVGPITMAAINTQMANGLGDRVSPFIGPVAVTSTNTGATINWSTNENSAAIIYYSTSPISMIEGEHVTIGGSSLLVHTDLRVSHSGVLTGLTPNTTYYYVVYVRDGSGNESITWPSAFQTAN
jgi:hypothetical protein